MKIDPQNHQHQSSVEEHSTTQEEYFKRPTVWFETDSGLEPEQFHVLMERFPITEFVPKKLPTKGNLLKVQITFFINPEEYS